MGQTAQLREVRVTAYQDPNDLQVTVTSEDADDSERTLNLESSAEAKYGTAVYGVDEYVKQQRRERRLDYRQSGRWFQVKVENDTKAVPMQLERIELGILPTGRR
jgi:hypothetical protein